MPITLHDLTGSIDPKRTALLLGAGASVPSGAPTGAALAHLLWTQVAKSGPVSDDLMETTSILCRRYNRSVVVDEIVKPLKRLRPTAGLLALPNMEWNGIFTTNFDQLVETAFRQHRVPLAVFRTNYDFSRKEDAVGKKLFKLHGCISQDRSKGDKASMILTEDDYDEFKSFRAAIFAELQRSLMQGDVLVVGQSLRDQHLQTLVREVLKTKNEGAPGNVYVLAYEPDDIRAPLLEDRGARIAFGGIDELMHAFAQASVEPQQTLVAEDNTTLLQFSLLSTVKDIAVEVSSGSNVIRMFNGGPATYADIASSVIFERDQQTQIADQLHSHEIRAATIIGSAGVGKTTMARAIAFDLHRRGLGAWEHKNEFNFQHKAWIETEVQLRAAGRRAILVLDECTHFMKGVNTLLDHLGSIDRPAIQLLITANASQWTPRLKSPNFFVKAKLLTISALSDVEIRSLLNLVEQNRVISNLVQAEFKREGRNRQFERLRQKCSADMFVCLKNIFANENLDTILLQEYDELSPGLQEYYRFVSALEAVGTRVHRQLILRMLNVSASEVGAVLSGLAGIVDEYDINPSRGIFGWSTRHVVIARKITEYKFSHIDELTKLFEQIIDNANPVESIELQSLRALCDVDYGIGRIGDAPTRERLYRRLVKLVPGERIPWHRLIREKLQGKEINDTEYLIRDAAEAVGTDSPIDRYKVRLLILRSQVTPGISEADRLALLRKAYELAMKNTHKHRLDKYSFRELCNVGVELAKRGESWSYLDEAIVRMREATGDIMDPELDRLLQSYEGVRARLR